MSEGQTEADLRAGCADFAKETRAIPIITPVVDSIGGFVAVIPRQTSSELERLAADCVRAFDCFRAPLTPEDRARRHPAKLSPRQIEYLDCWGYPYVVEEFRFHMTLTGCLGDRRRDSVLATLCERFARLALGKLAVDHIALFRRRQVTIHNCR